MKTLDIPKNDSLSMASLDIQSMYNNIPIDITLSYINFRYPDLGTDIDRSLLIKIIHFILTSSYFIHDKKIYRQIFGVPQGGPLSPVIANIFMVKLENDTFSSLANQPIFYRRFIDDTIIISSPSIIKSILDKFNSFHIRVNFTIEDPR